MVMGSLGIAQGIYLHADPMLDTWLTQTSGLYARIYQDIEDMHDGHSVTTWSGGQGTILPVCWERGGLFRKLGLHQNHRLGFTSWALVFRRSQKPAIS